MSPLLFHVSSYAAAVSTCAVPQSSPMHEVAMVGAPGGYMKATIPAPSTTSSLEIYVRGMSKPTTTASAATGNNVSDGSSSGFTSSRSRSSSTTSNSSSSCMSSMEEEQEDRPPTWSGKDVYCLPKPSSWRLHKGKVEEFTTASAGRIMLCTDLDGTLIEDGDESSEWVQAANAATAEFNSWWSHHCAPAGGLLVFNTGRSIGMVTGLLNKKHMMPRPDVIITAVGTKVFHWCEHARDWVADAHWAAQLDDDWDVGQVLAVAEGLRRSHGDRLVINDGGTEHPHRVSMTIPADLHGHVVGAWSSALAAAGIKVGEVVEAMPCGIIVT
eukprot:jgi/Chrzof1/3508/Cz12g28020.t1